jgi:transcription-repair coupling factor (superfamily II helicase)
VVRQFGGHVVDEGVVRVPVDEREPRGEGALQEGWRLRTADGDLHLFTDAEVFGWSRPEPRRRKVVRRAKTPELAYADMHEGDYVVHIDYGVGKFVGMRRRTLEGVEREYLLIEYGGTDTLFVPIHQADRLALCRAG